MDTIINYRGKLYIIDREPYETIEDCYNRGWYIIKNIDKPNINETISFSILKNNMKKGMVYEKL
jgi:hypothetical protein